MTYFMQSNCVCLSFFLVVRNEKNVSLLPEKNNNFFLAFFLFCFRQKKTSLPFAWLFKNKEKSNSNFLYLQLLFVSSFFFASPVMTIDDRWVGGGYKMVEMLMTSY